MLGKKRGLLGIAWSMLVEERSLLDYETSYQPAKDTRRFDIDFWMSTNEIYWANDWLHQEKAFEMEVGELTSETL